LSEHAVIVDLESISPDGPTATVLALAETVESGTDLVFDRVQGEIRLTRTSEIVWVSGRVAATVTVPCGRCLRSCAHRLEGRFREGFRIQAGRAAGEQSGGDLILTLAGPTLDVTDVVRQHLLLALPMTPLCRPDCRGLCPVCGVDRNDVVCGCVPDRRDPRLATLQRFRPTSG
jgi:uncharacterized protein